MKQTEDQKLGETTPQSRIYGSPPLPDDCAGQTWPLRTRAHLDGD